MDYGAVDAQGREAGEPRVVFRTHRRLEDREDPCLAVGGRGYVIGMDADVYDDFTLASSLIDADRAAVWSVLTNDTGALFMGAEFETDWSVGQPITFRGEWKGSTYHDHGTIVSFDEPHLLQFTQFSSMSGKQDTPANYDLVSFELTDSDGGTRATMRLGKPKGVTPPSGDELVGLTANLDQILAVLKDLAETS